METAITMTTITMTTSEAIALVILGQFTIIFLIGLGAISYLLSKLIMYKLKKAKEDKNNNV